MIVSVQRPKGRLRHLWLPIPSLSLYLLAWTARVALWFVPKRVLKKRGRRPIPVDLKTIGRAITRLARVLLCSGPYVLCDVYVKSDGVRVKVALW